MRANYRFFAALTTSVFLVCVTTSFALDMRQIEKVRNKGVLDDGDFRVIDSFVAQAVQELLQTTDFTSIANTRSTILANSTSATGSAAAQYTQQFSESAYKHIASGMAEARQLTPEDRRLKIITNLLILADSLADPRLTDLALEMANNHSTVVRYWAVHAVTNQSITERLNSGGAASLGTVEKITDSLKTLATEETSCEIIVQIAEFAAATKAPQGQELLVQIADRRISQYTDWTVDCELLDATICKLLSDRVLSTKAGRSDVARRFAQLYSCVIQRYVKGKNSLDKTRKQQLASVLIETEQACISKLLRIPQSVIRKAIERNDVSALTAEHNRLLGGLTGTGALAKELKFDYGKTGDGVKLTSPLELPMPPKLVTSR